MRRLQCAAAVITVFGVAHWLTATWLFATSEPSISGDHPGMMSEDKLEHKLKLISQSTAKMEVQMSKLLLEVERLQASGTKSGSVHGRHRRKALADKAGTRLTSSARIAGPTTLSSLRRLQLSAVAGPDNVLSLEEAGRCRPVVPIWPRSLGCARRPMASRTACKTRCRRFTVEPHRRCSPHSWIWCAQPAQLGEAAYGERYAAQGDPPHQ